jgi:hypothetical protein
LCFKELDTVSDAQDKTLPRWRYPGRSWVQGVWQRCESHKQVTWHLPSHWRKNDIVFFVSMAGVLGF